MQTVSDLLLVALMNYSSRIWRMDSRGIRLAVGSLFTQSPGFGQMVKGGTEVNLWGTVDQSR